MFIGYGAITVAVVVAIIFAFLYVYAKHMGMPD